MVFPFFILVACIGTKYTAKPKYKHFGQIAYFFKSTQEMASWFNLKPHDVIAEIGAGDGLNIVDLALLTDSLSFYLQDIDSLTLSLKKLTELFANAKTTVENQLTNFIE